MLRKFTVGCALLLAACGDTEKSGTGQSADGNAHPIASDGDPKVPEIQISKSPAKTDLTDPAVAGACDARAAAATRGTFTAVDSLALKGALGVSAALDRPNTISFAFDFPTQLWQEAGESWAQDVWTPLALDVLPAPSSGDPFTIGSVNTVRLWSYVPRKSECSGTSIQSTTASSTNYDIGYPPITDSARLTITNRTADRIEGSVIDSDGSPLFSFQAPLVPHLTEFDAQPCCLAPRANTVAAADSTALICAARADHAFHGNYAGDADEFGIYSGGDLTAEVGDKNQLELSFGDQGYSSLDANRAPEWTRDATLLTLAGLDGAGLDLTSTGLIDVAVTNEGSSVEACNATSHSTTPPSDPRFLGNGKLQIEELTTSSIKGSIELWNGATLRFTAPFQKALPASDPSLCCVDPTIAPPPPTTTTPSTPPTEAERVAYCAANPEPPSDGSITGDPELGLDGAQAVASTAIASYLDEAGVYHFDRRFDLSISYASDKFVDPTNGPSLGSGFSTITLTRSTTRTPSLPFAVGRYEDLGAWSSDDSYECHQGGGSGGGGSGPALGAYTLVITNITDTTVEGSIEISVSGPLAAPQVMTFKTLLNPPPYSGPDRNPRGMCCY